MKENPWKCEKCGSTNLDQEWVFYAPMNEQAEAMVDAASEASKNDFYWCKDCEEECSPIRDREKV